MRLSALVATPRGPKLATELIVVKASAVKDAAKRAEIVAALSILLMIKVFSFPMVLCLCDVFGCSCRFRFNHWLLIWSSETTAAIEFFNRDETIDDNRNDSSLSQRLCRMAIFCKAENLCLARLKIRLP